MKPIGDKMQDDNAVKTKLFLDPSILAILLLGVSFFAIFYPGFRWLGFVIPGLLLVFPRWWENCLLSLPITMLSLAVMLIAIGNYIAVLRSGLQLD